MNFVKTKIKIKYKVWQNGYITLKHKSKMDS